MGVEGGNKSLRGIGDVKWRGRDLGKQDASPHAQVRTVCGSHLPAEEGQSMTSSENSVTPGRHDTKKYWNHGMAGMALQVTGCKGNGTMTVCSVVSTEYKSSERYISCLVVQSVHPSTQGSGWSLGRQGAQRALPECADTSVVWLSPKRHRPARSGRPSLYCTRSHGVMIVEFTVGSIQQSGACDIFSLAHMRHAGSIE